MAKSSADEQSGEGASTLDALGWRGVELLAIEHAEVCTANDSVSTAGGVLSAGEARCRDALGIAAELSRLGVPAELPRLGVAAERPRLGVAAELPWPRVPA